MKRQLFMLSLVIGTAFALSSCSTTSHVAVAQGVNFNSYKTFGWTNDVTKKAGRVDNDIIDNKIKNSISADLEKKGWQETDQQPDVLIDYNVMVEKKVKKEADPVYAYPYSGYYYNGWRHRMGFFYNPVMLAGYHTYNVPFKEGTLTVNMMDAHTNKLIWQGWSRGEVGSRNVTTNDVKHDVKSMFKKFDLPKLNS